MNEKVYVVQEGEYSDRSICGIFTSKEKADAAVCRFGGDIEEFPVDMLDYEPYNMTIYSVEIDKEGDIKSCYKEEGSWLRAEELASDPRNIHFLDEVFSFQTMSFSPTTMRMITRMFARDEKHAIKIANKTRSWIIAEGRWPEKSMEEEEPAW